VCRLPWQGALLCARALVAPSSQSQAAAPGLASWGRLLSEQGAAAGAHHLLCKQLGLPNSNKLDLSIWKMTTADR
jgi:hypothetical protein